MVEEVATSLLRWRLALRAMQRSDVWLLQLPAGLHQPVWDLV